MFENIDEKIKKLGKAIFIVGIFLSVSAAIALFLLAFKAFSYNQMWIPIFLGAVLLVFGPIFSWALSLIVYGFGELIENSYDK